MVSHDEILKEAKEIMDSFMKELDGVELEENFILEREECFREDGEPLETNEEFRQTFLSNAPNTKGNAIVANKGSWVK